MIRVVMLGRLANNLFQYAFGRTLAEKHGTELQIDGSWFNGRTWKYVEDLQRFPGMSSSRTTLTRPFSLGSRILKKATHKHHWEYLRLPIIREQENNHSFDPRLLDAPEDCVIFGYFQSWRYFDSISEQLRRELSTAEMGLEVGYERLSADLRAPGSVAIHVRRTDYVNNRNLVLLDAAYYQLAIDRIRRRIAHPRFFIFSDDPAWCLKNFSGTDRTVVVHDQPVSPLVDLHLMSLADHHIIANSSYSWWAAWLGRKPDQQVLMPPAWFKGISAPIGDKQCANWEIVSG
jgi:hypothetical protein